MEPGRIHAYLQAACAGLGFDIGEVWFSRNKSSGPFPNPGDEKIWCIGDDILTTMRRSRTSDMSNELKFLQLYTSKSYNDRRNDLLRPASGEYEDTQKHVLSPDVVNVISSTAQVVWAHCPKREGLLGRSDMRVHTVIGMPVAVDSDGSMCVVVMFSAKHIHSNVQAMEYLKLLRQTARSHSIPGLLPVMDSHEKLLHNLERFYDWKEQKVVSLSGYQENNVNHEVTLAPKDPYGIPILPSTSELDTNHGGEKYRSSSSDDLSNAFDLASYGIWSTVMDIPSNNDIKKLGGTKTSLSSQPTFSTLNSTAPKVQTSSLTYRCESLLSSDERPYLQPERGDRLEEFASAFLDISVFDLADVWIPVSNNRESIELHHSRSVSVAGWNEDLNYLMQGSQNSVIKSFSGVIGRAYTSGTPMWGTNQDLIADIERAEAIKKANVKTMLAVPILSRDSRRPSGVFCCYSLVQSDSVSFLLKFVQQALITLWMGLDHVEPNTHIGKDKWKDVGPSDLGEMAADLEMQKAFHQKKRSFGLISSGRQNSGEKTASGEILSKPRIQTTLPFDLTQTNGPFDGSFMNSHLSNYNSINSYIPGRNIFSAISGNSDISLANEPTNLHQVSSGTLWTNNSQDFMRKVIRLESPQAGSFIPLKINDTTDSRSLNMLQSQTDPFVQSITNTNTCGESDIVAPSNRKEDIETAIGNIHEFNDLVRKSKYQCQDLRVTKYTTNNVPLNQEDELVKRDGSYPMSTGTNSQLNIRTTTKDTILQNSLPGSLSHNDISQTTSSITAINTIDNATGGVAAAISTDDNTTGGAQLIHAHENMFCKPVSCVSIDKTTSSNPSQKKCRIIGCVEVSVSRRPYCHRHSGNRLCEYPSCSKCAQGATRFCIAHGGGRRCTYKGCDKGARDKYFCAAHGGGRRCKSEGCNKSAVGGSNCCTSHGGGRRCAIDGCGKSAQSSTKFCVKHGGGKKCTYPGCYKVSRGKTAFCAGHGGGIRCKLEGCNRIAVGKMQMCKWHNQSNQRSTSSLIHTPLEDSKLTKLSSHSSSTIPSTEVRDR